MDTKSKKSTKWIILGSIVLIVAILLAVGPGLFMKYMRAKWQDGSKYKVSTLKMQVKGVIRKANDGIIYLKGDNNLFYILENISQDQNIDDKINQECSVRGSFRQANNNETVDGNPVRLFIDVDKLIFKDSELNLKQENKDVADANNVNDRLKEKYRKKAELRLKANTILNKPILFDVINGSVSALERKTLDGKDYTAYVLTDEFGDRYALYKKGKDLKNLEGQKIIVLGREILPEKNIALFIDETTFELYEVYDEQYNKIM